MSPYERLYKYAHMSPNDVQIWERFISAYPDRYTTVTYDFALGTVPVSASPDLGEIGGRSARLYQKRIDVLAESEGETHIIEVKPKAGASALGQVLSYAELYKQFVDPSAKTVPIIVTDTVGTDMALLAHAMGVTLVIV